MLRWEAHGARKAKTTNKAVFKRPYEEKSFRRSYNVNMVLTEIDIEDVNLFRTESNCGLR